jgi:hypothetical protein
MIKHALALTLLLLPTHAKDVGQSGNNGSPELRVWFNSVHNRGGFKCCVAADGYPVEYQMRSDNHYWVRFKDEWYEVPDEAVVREYGNPTGSGVVWSPKYLVGGRSAASCR